jgi:preprotein translocase subunit SecE
MTDGRRTSVAKADENDSTEPTSPASSTPDDGSDRLDGRPEAGGDEPELTTEQAEFAAPDDAAPGRSGSTGDQTPAEQSQVDGEDELVPVGAPRGEARAGRTGRAQRTAREDQAELKQRQAADRPRRTTPPQFVRQSIAELRKVVYPTGQQLASYFVVVLIFVLFIIAIVSLLDLAFGWVILRVFS